jgi:hypothetical protein
MQNFIRFTLVMAIITVSLFTSEMKAEEKPIQLSLFNPVQIVPEDQSVKGFRFNLIYGKNAAVTGLDIGLVNMTTGLETGLQWGAVSVTDGGFVGWQSNFVTISKGNSTGVQWSSVNYHDGHFHGLQVALVNYAATMRGIQIGFLNIIKEGGFLPIFPFFNFSFKE